MTAEAAGQFIKSAMLPATDEVSAIDRLAPTHRPKERVVMRQQWRDLLFLHWEVPIAALRALIPPELSLDTYDDKAYIGLVPFTMRNVRPIWSPSVPFLSHFHETNVRAYVHYQGRDPGVWFFSLDAANPIAVQIARMWFKLPYYYARMRMEKRSYGLQDGEERRPQTANLSPTRAGNPIINQSPPMTVEYLTERLWPAPVPARCEVNWTPDAGVRHAQPDTLEHFLIERYILYTYRNGTLYSGRVHHPTYPVQNATVHQLQENLIAQAGVTRPDTPPPLVHSSLGVDVDIFPLRHVNR